MDSSHRGSRPHDLLVFNGDIIKDWYGKIAIVRWEYEFYLHYHDDHKHIWQIGAHLSYVSGDGKFEIIGNIYDHEHLFTDEVVKPLCDAQSAMFQF